MREAGNFQIFYIYFYIQISIYVLPFIQYALLCMLYYIYMFYCLDSMLYCTHSKTCTSTKCCFPSHIPSWQTWKELDHGQDAVTSRLRARWLSGGWQRTGAAGEPHRSWRKVHRRDRAEAGQAGGKWSWEKGQARRGQPWKPGKRHLAELCGEGREDWLCKESQASFYFFLGLAIGEKKTGLLKPSPPAHLTKRQETP